MTTADKKGEGSACGCGARTGGSSHRWIWIVLALAIVGVLLAKEARKGVASCGTGTCVLPPTAVPAIATTNFSETSPTAVSALPRLVDFGAGKCASCKMMTPVLEDMKKTYAGKLEVQFIDVWENPDLGKTSGIDMIPTQIFYDATGKERFRHMGFFSKEDIIAKWGELGVELKL